MKSFFGTLNSELVHHCVTYTCNKARADVFYLEGSRSLERVIGLPALRVNHRWSGPRLVLLPNDLNQHAFPAPPVETRVPAIPAGPKDLLPRAQV
jgi:hypothetical protein